MSVLPTGADALVGVLALQGDFREHETTLRSLGVATRRVRTVEDLEGIDALVVPGGESTTMSNLALRWGLMEPMRALVHSGLPAYGSCAGMIMLADRIEGGRPDQETIGGLDVTVLRNAFGRQVDSFEADIDIPVLGPEPLHAVFIRAPWVEDAGESVQVLGRVPAGPAAGRIVAVRQGHLLATSFHPELTGDMRVHEYFVEMVREQA